jgi:hypothetical protein
MIALAAQRRAASPMRTPRAYVAVAAVVAVAAQIGFVAIFTSGDHAAARADGVEPPHGEMAVAVDAVSDLPLLKYGSEKPSTAAGRPAAHPRATRGATPPPRTTRAAGATAAAQALPALPETPELPSSPTSDPTSTSANADPEPATGPIVADAGPPAAASTLGSALGSDSGTEIDPLKARAAASYRSQLDNWFSARFHIRGKVPFDRLEKLAASVVVSVSERHVVSFSLAAPSGDPVFDGQLRADLNAIQSSGVELPAPPPTHPELLGTTVSLRFACSIRAYCE